MLGIRIGQRYISTSGQEVKVEKIFLKKNKPYVKVCFHYEEEPDSTISPLEVDITGDNNIEISFDDFEREYRKIQ